MILTAPTLENFTFSLTREVQIRATLEQTFDALLEQMGPANETHEGKPMPMRIEARPGGRWYRDLGNDDGHLWGLVQAIKRPTLLEITGPLFISHPVISNVQYRLTAVADGTLLSFRHAALGFMSDDLQSGLTLGWLPMLERIHRQAESA